MTFPNKVVPVLSCSNHPNFVRLLFANLGFDGTLMRVVRWSHSVVLCFTASTTNRAVTDLPQQKRTLKYSLLFWQMWHRVQMGFFCFREDAYRHFWPISGLVENYYRHARNVSLQCSSLAHFLSLASFYTSWKISEKHSFSDFLRKYTKRPVAWNKLHSPFPSLNLTCINYPVTSPPVYYSLCF